MLHTFSERHVYKVHVKHDLICFGDWFFLIIVGSDCEIHVCSVQ